MLRTARAARHNGMPMHCMANGWAARMSLGPILNTRQRVGGERKPWMPRVFGAQEAWDSHIEMSLAAPRRQKHCSSKSMSEILSRNDLGAKSAKKVEMWLFASLRTYPFLAGYQQGERATFQSVQVGPEVAPTPQIQHLCRPPWSCEQCACPRRRAASLARNV